MLISNSQYRTSLQLACRCGREHLIGRQPSVVSVATQLAIGTHD